MNNLRNKTLSTIVLALLLTSSLLFIVPLTNAASPLAVPALGLGATSGNVADTITVNGTGFPSGQADITFVWIRVSDNTIAAPNPAVVTVPSITSIGGAPANSFDADANGYFKVKVTVPTTTGGAYILSARYTTAAAVATNVNATFSITPKLTFSAALSRGYPGQTTTWTVTGMGNAETVNLATGTPAALSIITGTTSAAGSFTSAAATINEVNGGAKTFTASGVTSGLTVSATFTIRTRIDAPASIRRDAGTSFTITPHGFANGLVIPADSILVGAATTSHSAATIDTTGTVAGGITVSLTSLILTQGMINITIAGTTYSLQAGNINNAGGNAIIASTPQTGAISTAVITLDASSYSVGDTVKMWGAGFTATTAAGATVTGPDGAGASGVQAITGGAVAADTNGALYLTFTLAAVAQNDAVADRTITWVKPGAGAGSTDVPAGKSISIIPKLTSPAPLSSGTVGAAVTVTGSGFSTAEDISVTVAGVAFGTPITAATISAVGAFTTGAVALPTVPGGLQTFLAAGTSAENSATATYTVKLLIGATALSVATGASGTGITLSNLPAQISGLKASSLYTVRYGGENGVNIGTFVSTALGTVPASTRVTIPSAILGVNIIDIVNASATPAASVVWNNMPAGEQYANLLFVQLATVLSLPSSGFVGNTLSILASSLAPETSYDVYFGATLITSFNSTATGTAPATATFTVPLTGAGLGAERTGTPVAVTIRNTLTSALVGTGTFTLFSSMTITPASGPVGTAVAVTGSGWNPGSSYAIIFGGNLLSVPAAPGRIVATFTANAEGDVPPNLQFTVPPDATGTSNVDVALVATPTVSSLLIRSAFTVTNVISGGNGTNTFTPAAPALLNGAGAPATSIAKGAQYYASFNVTSNSNTAISPTVIAQVKDSAGRVVFIGLSQPDIGAGATKTVQVPLIASSTAGTYTVTLFIWDSITSATPLSPTSTLSVTVA